MAGATPGAAARGLRVAAIPAMAGRRLPGLRLVSAAGAISHYGGGYNYAPSYTCPSITKEHVDNDDQDHKRNSNALVVSARASGALSPCAAFQRGTITGLHNDRLNSKRRPVPAKGASPPAIR